MKLNSQQNIIILIIGLAFLIVLVFFTVINPLSYSLFEMTNWDTTHSHSVRVIVSDDLTQKPVFEEIITLSPGQRIERGIQSWDNNKNFNFSVRLDQMTSSQFTMNLWRGQRGVIDIADPVAGDMINPCIHYYNTGGADYGHQEPVFIITNEDTNNSHTVEVTVANGTGGIIFKHECTVPPGQDIYSSLKGTFVAKQYIVTVSDAGSSLLCIKDVGPYTSNCRIIIRDSGLEIFESDEIFDGTYGLPYWKGKCSGQTDGSGLSPAATLNIPPVD
jgi:hypothetical protein